MCCSLFLFLVIGYVPVLGQGCGLGQSELELQVDINEVSPNSGVYRIHLNPFGKVSWVGSRFKLKISFEILSTTNTILATYHMKDVNGKEPLFFSEQSAGSTTANFWAASNFIYDYVLDIPSIIAANNQSLSDVASVKVTSAIDDVLNTDVVSTNAQIHYPDGFNDNILFSPNGVVEMEHTMPITNGLMQQTLSVLPLQTTKSNFYCQTNSQMFYAVGYGGQPPYTYTWQKNVNGNVQNASPLVVVPGEWGGLSTSDFVFNGDYNIEEVYQQNFVSTPTATHTVTVTDANGNTVTASTEYIRPTVTFSQEALLNALVPSTTNECMLDMTVPVSSLFSNELGEPITWNEYHVIGEELLLNTPISTVSSSVITLYHCRTDCVYGFNIAITDDMLAGSVDASSLPTSGTLTGEYRVRGTWVIPTGNTVTLDNAHIQFTTESSKILVQKGAKLIVGNNSLLEAFRCNTNLPNVWQGIRVIGTPTMDHPGSIDPLTQLNNFFGIVIVDNATIKHAKIAICNTNTNDPTNISTYFDGTKVGGLIYTANNSFLTDNEVGIYLHKFSNKQNMSRITGTTFNTVNGFEGTFNLYNNNNNPIGTAVGIVCIANNLRRPIVRNTFMGNNNATIAQQKGVGIHNANSYMNVGNGTVEGQNTFVNNYKGVDYYSSPSLLTQFKVKTNIFTNNVRSITLTGGALAEITQNQIYEVPTDNYGIFLDATKGFILDHNIVQSNQPNSMGLLIKNTGDYASEITENSFGGAFLYGNIFIDKNEKVKIDCNTYHTQKDWVIFPSNLVDAFLEPQGECDPDDAQKARRNMFHDPQIITNPNARHILNLSTTNEVFYRSYPNQELIPTLVTGNANVGVCNEVSGLSQCSQFFGLDYCNPDDIWAALVSNSTMGDKERLLEYTKLLYARLCQDQHEQAKTDLNTEARDASYKVLTATYTDENDTIKALESLSKLSLSDPENVDFYNLFMQLLNSPIGSGKNSPAAVALNKVAQQNDHSSQALAQSIVASNSLSVFDKVVPDLKGNNLTNNTVNCYFKITPNPAANKATISLSPTIKKGKILVYDTLGRLIEQKPIEQQLSLELSYYANGVYCIMLTDEKNIPVYTQKLIVVQ